MKTCSLSRRSFLAAVGTAPLAFRALAADHAARKRIPVGIQMYSVRDDEKRDLMGTLKGLREMGYECVEFWAPYYDWTAARAKEVRKHLDDLGLRCYSNHTAVKHFADEHLPHVIELNHILGSRYVIMAHAGPQKDLDGWRTYWPGPRRNSSRPGSAAVITIGMSIFVP
jgi:sugar phosphate isomerase/epimerase